VNPYKVLVCDDDDKEYPVREIFLVGCIDPGGFSEDNLLSKSASRNAFVIAGQPKNSIKKFVVYAFAGRMKEPSKFATEVFNAHNLWKPRHWKIEVYGQQGFIYNFLREQAKEQKIPNFYISATPKVMNKDAKEDRIQALMTPLEQGEIYFLKTMKYLNDIKQEFINYPKTTKDLVDCLGWLNQLYFTRSARSDIDKDNEGRVQRALMARNKLTGY
jgi:hypothetical protein